MATTLKPTTDHTPATVRPPRPIAGAAPVNRLPTLFSKDTVRLTPQGFTALNNFLGFPTTRRKTTPSQPVNPSDDPAPKMYPVLDHKDNGTLFAAHAQWEAAVGADRAKAAAAQRQAQGQGQRSATPDSGNPSSASKAQPKKK
ncbi:hypothetical protein PQX77_006662 [Marasmius sp. AFHP31]|nr:hypothetical protein PQX77_006662 [Marasmius sp. AFHP31]